MDLERNNLLDINIPYITSNYNQCYSCFGNFYSAQREIRELSLSLVGEIKITQNKMLFYFLLILFGSDSCGEKKTMQKALCVHPLIDDYIDIPLYQQ